MEHSLVTLFPNTSLGAGITSPLSAADFCTLVLLPEVAVQLIMNNLTQDRREALETLNSSIWYGDSQYPLNAEDETKYDQMVFEEYHDIRRIQSSYSDQQDGGDRSA